MSESVADHACSVREQPFGFEWCGVEVLRCAEFRLTHVLQVKHGKRNVNIYISPTGRSIRVYLDGEELVEKREEIDLGTTP